MSGAGPVSFHPVDALFSLLLLEAVGLLLWHRRTGRGPAPQRLVPNLLAGAFLLAALRTALVDGPRTVLLLWLAAAFFAHLLDLRVRWSGRSG
jgi:hypothetical protein